MIPIKLTIMGFGPYRDKNEIDFSKLEGLFLMYGDTGSGKSAILDAMTFAIFGESSGGERGKFADMRCNLCEDDEETLVEFVFAKGGREYYFKREIVPYKKRNGGTELKEQISAGELEDGGRKPFAPNIRQSAATEYAESVLGLTPAQFRQVVMLPQGKFEKLLISDVGEREELMRTLFGTALWDDAAARLADMSKELGTTVNAKKAELAFLMNRYGVSDMEELTASCEAACEAARKAAAAEKTAKAAREKALAEKHAADELAALFAERSTKEEELEKLDERLAAAPEVEERIRRARLAMTIEKSETLLNSARDDVKKRTEAEQQTKRSLDAADRALADAKKAKDDAEENAEKLDEIKERITLLKERARSFELLKTADDELKAAKKVYDDADEAAKAAQKEAEEAESARDSATKRLNDIAVKKETAKQLEAEVKKLYQREKAEQELRDITAKGKSTADSIAEKKRELERLESERAAADSAYEAARERYEEDVVSAVASKLHDGDICPVCGGVYMSRGANTHSGDIADPEPLRKKADEIARKISGVSSELAALSEARRNLLDRHAEKKAAIEEIGEPDAEAQKKLDEIEQLIKSENGAREMLAKAEETLKKERPGTESAAAALAAAQEKRDSLAKSCGEKDPAGEIDAAEKKLSEMQNAVKNADKAYRDAENARAEASAKWEAACGELDESEKKAEGYLSQFEKEIGNSGFKDEGDYMKAKLTHDETERLDSEQKKLREDENSLKVRLIELMNRTEGKDEPDTEKAAAELAAAEEAAEAGIKQAAEKSGMAADMKRDLATAEKKAAEALKAGETFERLDRFAKLLRGDKGVGIGRFVLGIMLDRVTEEANKLLVGVHGGRYSLVRRTGENVKNKKAGLDLDVYDNNARCGEEVRNVTTLSGGEKFLASLALSLGLSTVVKSQSGGVAIDAMFIDEGFGTLDEESLADALDMLASLESGNRTVGIISHVDRLKETIQKSVEVKKEKSGSKVTVHI